MKIMSLICFLCPLSMTTIFLNNFFLFIFHTMHHIFFKFVIYHFQFIIDLSTPVIHVLAKREFIFSFLFYFCYQYSEEFISIYTHKQITKHGNLNKWLTVLFTNRLFFMFTIFELEPIVICDTIFFDTKGGSGNKGLD